MIRLQYMFMNHLKSEEIAAHYHSSYEITYYFSGKGYCDFLKEPIAPSAIMKAETTHYLPQFNQDQAKTRIYFKQGDCIVLPPNTIHYKNHTENSQFLSLVFDIDDPEIIPKHNLYGNLLGKKALLFSNISDEYSKKRSLYQKMVESLLAELCIELNREELVTGGINDFIHQTAHYFDDYYLSDIDLTSYCQNNGYSIDYFRHKFKEIVQCSPKAYIMKKRMEYAESLLRLTDYPIHIIADMCKFGDYAQFSVYFSQKNGLSPSVYRKKYANSL